MTALTQYNNLDGKVVSRKQIIAILKKANKEKELRIVRKLRTLLSNNKQKEFDITITEKLTTTTVSKPKRKSKKRVVSSIATKKNQKLKVYGLGVPYVDLVSTKNRHSTSRLVHPEVVLPNVTAVSIDTRMKDPVIQPKVISKSQVTSVKRPKGIRTMADLDNQTGPLETYILDTEIGRFLGKLEKKPKGSVAITLDAPAGSGKTRFFFQVMEDYASIGKRSLFLTLEEHSQSQLFKDKRDQYISSQNYQYISIVDADEIKNYQDLKALILAHDVILVDSFGKLRKLIKDLKLELDEHLRIAFDGKLFFLIFQRTTGKTMRGGADSEFDGDVILQVEKPTENYQDNYVTARKNRYNPIPNLQYNVYHKKIIQDVESIEEQPQKPEPKRKLVVHSLDN